VSDHLTTYLEAIAASLDADEETDPDRSDDQLRSVARVVHTLLDGDSDPEGVHEEWPGFFRLVGAFVLAYGSPRLCHLQQRSSLFEGWGDDPLTDYDPAFLETLLREVDAALRERGLAQATGEQMRTP
jgi:hypothetical protein